MVDSTKMLVHAFVICRLDNCSSVIWTSEILNSKTSVRSELCGASNLMLF